VGRQLHGGGGRMKGVRGDEGVDGESENGERVGGSRGVRWWG